MRTLCVSLLLCVLSCAAGDFPADIQKCHFADSDCLVRTAQQVINNNAQSGQRELNLVPFAPLHVNLLKLERNPASPVNVELQFKDSDLIGLQDLKVTKFKGLDAELKEFVELEANVPKLILKGHYVIDGSVLILPIVGKGDAEIILTNMDIRIKIKPKSVEKAGHAYLDVDALKLSIRPKHVNIRLENLFNGNKELSDTMNVFINENWKEVFSELRPSVEEGLSLILTQIINNIFSKNPYEDYFLKN